MRMACAAWVLVCLMGGAAWGQESPAPAQPEAPKATPEQPKPEQPKPEQPKPEQPKPEQGKPEPAKPAAKAPEITPAAPKGMEPMKIGDLAPELKVQSWVKGGPVVLEKGKIYVVELWATWSKPCVDNIARLTEVQHTYKAKGVRVIGVSIWEDTPPNTIDLPPGTDAAGITAAYLQRVKDFVQQQGDAMDYAVAFDGIEGETAKWMFRLAQSGVPCAFVINREGKIVWVGHPADVSKVVGEVLAGTYDMSVAAERVGKEAERARKIRELEAKYRDAQKAGDQTRALEVIDEFVELSPEQFQPEIELKFKTLLVDMKDDKAAYAYARKVSEGVAKNLPEPLDGMAWLILEGEGVAVRDYDVALALSQRADELTNHGKPSVLETLARAYFEKGDVDKAIETQAKAIAACDEKNSDRSLRAELSAGLQKYRAAKK